MEPTHTSVSGDIAMAILGRHYEDQESATSEIREMRNRLKEAVVMLH